MTGGAGRFQKACRVDFWGLDGSGVNEGEEVGTEILGMEFRVAEALRWAEKRRFIVFSADHSVSILS